MRVVQPVEGSQVAPVNIAPHPPVIIRIPVKGNRALPPVLPDDDDDDPVEVPATLLHDIVGVPDFLERSLRSGCVCAAAGSSDDRAEPGGVPNDSVAFSAGLPGGIRLSDMPDPSSVCDALTSPDADAWQAAMDCEMQNLKSHSVYTLIPRRLGMHTRPHHWRRPYYQCPPQRRPPQPCPRPPHRQRLI